MAKIVFPMSGTSFLLNTVDFGNSSSIIPCLAWPTFVSKFNHIAPCFAFFFCTHISNSFLMTSRQQPNKEYQPRRLYIHCLLNLTCVFLFVIWQRQLIKKALHFISSACPLHWCLHCKLILKLNHFLFIVVIIISTCDVFKIL